MDSSGRDMQRASMNTMASSTAPHAAAMKMGGRKRAIACLSIFASCAIIGCSISCTRVTRTPQYSPCHKLPDTITTSSSPLPTRTDSSVWSGAHGKSVSLRSPNFLGCPDNQERSSILGSAPAMVLSVVSCGLANTKRAVL